MDDSLEMPLKQCSKCKQLLPATPEFFYYGQNKSGLYHRCKECRKGEKKYYKKTPVYEVPDVHKRCTKCGENKLATAQYFFRNKNVKSGISSYCKDCRIEEQRKRNSTEEKRKELALYARERRKRPEVKLAISRINWNQRHKNYEEFLARDQVRRDKNRERINERARRGYAANREKRIVAENNRRAILLAGTCTEQDIRAQYQKQDGKCYWCKKALSNAPRATHIDHVIPLSRGGTNDPCNIVIACQKCNIGRNNRLPEEWMQGRELL